MAKHTPGVRTRRRHPTIRPVRGRSLALERRPPALTSPGRPGPPRDARLAPRARGERGPHGPYFGFSRPTVYRRLERFDRFRLESLEDRPARPVRRRRPTWTLAQLAAVRRLRMAYPRWGKDKLAVLLRREGIRLSVSMVGRILARLRATGELREPTGRRVSVRRRTWRRPHAGRKPADGRSVGPATSSSSTPSTSCRCPPRSGSSSPPVTASAAGTCRAAAQRHGPDGGRRARRPRSADAVPGPGHQRRQRLRVHGRVRGRLRGPRRRPAHPAPAEPQPPRYGRARQPHPHRGVLRRHHRRRPSSRPSRSSSGSGRPSTTPSVPTRPSGYLSTGRVPGVAGDRCVTEVPNEYTRLTPQDRAATIPARCPAPG